MNLYKYRGVSVFLFVIGRIGLCVQIRGFTPFYCAIGDSFSDSFVSI